MKAVPCPLCGSEDASEVMTATDRLALAPGEFTLVKCASCGLVYLNPRPDDSELGAFYPGTYWGDRQKGVREFLRGVEERQKERYKLRALHRAGVTAGRVLDVGCGRGEFLSLLKRRGFDVAGVEPGGEAAKRGREDFGFEITCGTLPGVSLPEGAFDAVTLWHVLEHLPDPASTLRAIRPLLRPGGRLFIAVPDFGSLQAGIFGEGWFGVDAPRHLTHFTHETLSAMLAKEGFSKPVFYSGGMRYETAMLVRSAWPRLNFRKLQALERGRPSKYLYKAVQLVMDIGLLPAGAFLDATGRGSTFTAVSEKT